MLELLLANPWLLALAIFLARVGDVSLGTVRTIVVFRGYALLAAAIGFVEILLWVVAASQVLTNLQDWYLAVAYAGGFAAGNYVGIRLEGLLAMGDELVRIISFKTDGELGRTLRAGGFEPIELEGDMGDDRPVEVLIVEASRRQMPRLTRLVKETDAEAIYTINDIKRARHGHDPLRRRPTLFTDWLSARKRK